MTIAKLKEYLRKTSAKAFATMSGHEAARLDLLCLTYGIRSPAALQRRVERHFALKDYRATGRIPSVRRRA